MDRLALSVVVLSVALGLAPHAFDSYLVQKSEFEFGANATVTNDTLNATKRFGIVTEPNLWFGRLPAGSGSTKFLNVNAPRKTLVLIDSRGNISEHLRYREKLYFQGSREIAIRFNATEPGFYKGTVTIQTEMAFKEGGETWLDFKNWLYSYL